MKHFFLSLCVVLLLSTSAAVAANSAKPTIGIADFEIVGKSTHEANMRNVVSEWLTTYIVQSFRLNVVERQKLARVLEELALDQTGIINPEEAKKIGELSGAQALLVGSIFFVPDKDVLTVNCRLIDTTTGSIKAATKSGEILFGDSKQLENNLKDLAYHIIDYFPIEGYVVTVKDDTLVLNIGRLQGVMEGMRLLVYEPGEIIRDPVTGEVLEQEIHRTGYAKVTSVGEKTSKAAIISHEKPIKPKDRLRTTRIAEIGTSPREEGIIHFQDKNYRQAVAILQAHAADYANDAEYLYYLGQSLCFLARENNDIATTEAAISYLEKARQLKQECNYEIGTARFQLDLFGARARGLKNADNEPFLFVHPREQSRQVPRVGVVLVHGFTACPWEVRELGEYLFKQGYDVYGVLLAGHGTKPEDLCDIKWEQWYNSVENALTTIRMIADHIYLGGVSTGGSLCLLTASKYEVAGVISLASAIYLQDDMAMLAPVGKYLKKYNIRPLQDSVKPYYYEERSVAAVGQLNDLLSVVRKEIKKIDEPIIVFQSKEDKTIKPESGEFIYDNVSSKQREIVWFEASPHVLTTFVNKEQQRTIEAVAAFIKQTENLNNTNGGK